LSQDLTITRDRHKPRRLEVTRLLHISYEKYLSVRQSQDGTR
jgi:hypothetical protein